MTYYQELQTQTCVFNSILLPSMKYQASHAKLNDVSALQDQQI